MHLKRWITSIIAIPGLVALICKGSVPVFAVFIAVVASVALYEYFYIVFKGNRAMILSPIALSAFVIGFIMMAAAVIEPMAVMLVVFLGLMIAALLSMPAYKNRPDVLDTVMRQVQGVAYIPLSLSTLVLMRAGSDGITWIFFILFVVFLGDVGAYYVGTYKGKHRLNSSISPGKTIEGSLGGLGANLVVGLVFKAVFLPELPFLWTAVLVLVMGAAGQAGDLFESEMKRAAGIKDSGNILPGHGGLLDRIDALLFAAPVAYAWNMLVF